jgi:dihydroorotase
MSQAPARIAGLEGHGGALAVGQPANLTLVDPAAVVVVDRAESVSLSRNNPWHERKLTGAVVATYLRGEATYSEGDVRG